MYMIELLAAGLAFYLYGMKMVSEGLQKAADNRLRSILEVFTRNRALALLTGVFFTALISSSNAAAVITVGFVNSGLMQLEQTMGILLGANVGATVTGQLIAFDGKGAAPFCMLAGVMLVMFCGKNLRLSRLGEVILGFGIFFAGIYAISRGLEQVRNVDWLAGSLRSLSSPLAALLLGYGVTAVFQSNSVAVGILMLLARERLVDLPVCLFMMLGCNMGSTLSVILISRGCRKDARRTALVYFLFHLISSVISGLILVVSGDRVAESLLLVSGGDPGRAVANAYSINMIIWAALLLPLSGVLMTAACRIIPGEDRGKEEFELTFIGNRHTFSPTTAVLQAVREMETMGNLAAGNLKSAMDALLTGDCRNLEHIFQTERKIDFLNRKITDYLVRLNQSTLPIDDLMSVGTLFHVVNDMERIGDHAADIAEAAGTLREKELVFSSEARKELEEMQDQVMRLLSDSLTMFSGNDRTYLGRILQRKKKIDRMERDLQQNYVERLRQNIVMPETGRIFSDVVAGLERAADHGVHIAYSILEEDSVPEKDFFMEEK